MALAKVARDAVRGKLLPAELLDRINSWVGEYRAEHHEPKN